MTAAYGKTAARLCALCVMAACLAWLDPFRDEVKEGNGKFRSRDYRGAESHYRAAGKYAPGDRDKSKLRFNMGDSRYMQEDYEGAADHFRSSLNSDDREVQKKAFFNMGNAYYKQGKTREAVDAYVNALRIDPGYAPAKKNLEFLLQNRDQNKDGRDNKDGGQNGEGRDGGSKGSEGRDGGKDKDRQQAGKDAAGKQQKMSREQLMNLFESMQNKPVRREKGKADGERVLEKSW